MKVKYGEKIKLSRVDPEDNGEWKGRKKQGEERLNDLLKELDELQETIYAEHKHKILIVFQAMDTGGKDGVIRTIFSGINPQGVVVASFKVPTPIELDHDFLWRVHQEVPGKGQIVVFNRSHYEQVLVVRVVPLEPETTWRKHYQQINDFERLLAEEGTTIIKFFLHITKDEQKKRLLDRIDTPDKRWKFNPGDLDTRKQWDKYMEAYEDMLNLTSTEHAPWYVIPANDNWYRDLLVAETIVSTIKRLNPQYPSPVENIEQYRAQLL